MDLKTDAALITEVQNGNKDAFNEIISRYEPMILSIVSKFLSDELFGASDRDDLSQEASIALYNAVMSYDVSQGEVTFGLYAKICVNNSLTSALRKRRRQLKADQAQQDDAERKSVIGDRLEDAGLLLDRVDGLLSELERAVLRLLLRGFPHKESAERLGRDVKSVDNAVCRIRAKLSSKLL